jgi:hypothetical protein
LRVFSVFYKDLLFIYIYIYIYKIYIYHLLDTSLANISLHYVAGSLFFLLKVLWFLLLENGSRNEDLAVQYRLVVGSLSFQVTQQETSMATHTVRAHICMVCLCVNRH